MPDCTVLSPESEDSPRTVSTGGSHLEKGADNVVLTTRDCLFRSVDSENSIGPRKYSHEVISN
jgi:hypothetical protein